METRIQEFLEKNRIKYIVHTHKAVFTCEEADIHCKHVPGTPGKNLFLKEDKGNQFFLVILPADKKLKFANENELKEILGLTPGSVSPLGLLNDKEKKTRVIIDQEIWEAETVNFHPNINTESLEFTRDNFHRLITILLSNFEILKI